MAAKHGNDPDPDPENRMSAAPTMIRPPLAPDLSFEIRFERPAVQGTTGAPGLAARFYALRIEAGRQVPLEGVGAEPGWELVVTKGRVDGTHTSTRREPYPTLARAVERWGHFCSQRRAHGYREIPS
jgi:hypothetical protein